MRCILIFTLFFSFSSTVDAQEEIYLLCNQLYRFSITQEDTDVYYTWLSVYRTEETEPCFSAEMEEVWGDSNSLSIRMATYEVKDSILVLYHYWTKLGDAPVSPFGARKQIYQVTDKGEWVFLKGYITIETMTPLYIKQYGDREEHGYHTGAQFMRYSPQDEKDKELFRLYCQGIEEEYEATFLVGKKEVKELIEEVREKIKPQWQQTWGKWSEICEFPYVR